MVNTFKNMAIEKFPKYLTNFTKSKKNFNFLLDFHPSYKNLKNPISLVDQN